jgi:hypothetical protein
VAAAEVDSKVHLVPDGHLDGGTSRERTRDVARCRARRIP